MCLACARTRAKIAALRSASMRECVGEPCEPKYHKVNRINQVLLKG